MKLGLLDNCFLFYVFLRNFVFYSMCYYFSFWSDRVTGSIRFNLIKYLYKFNLNTGYLTESTGLIRFSHAVQPVTRWFDNRLNDPILMPS